MISKNKNVNTNGIIKKFENSTTTVNESRLSIFTPMASVSTSSKMYTDFVRNKKRMVIETDLGKTIIKGSILTQTHRDILDCLLSEAKDIRETPRGGVQVVISPDGLLKGYRGNSDEDIKWIKNKIDEVQVSAIEIHSQDGLSLFSFNIISSFAYSEERGLYVVEFSPEYCRFFNEQFTVNYTKELPALLAVKSPIIKAVVRFFWSHSKPISIHIDELLRVIGRYDMETKEAMLAKKKLISYIWDISEFGISYNNQTSEFSYSKCAFKNSISFVNPNKTLMSLPLVVKRKSTTDLSAPKTQDATVIEAEAIPKSRADTGNDETQEFIVQLRDILNVGVADEEQVKLTREERDERRKKSLPSGF
jgi:hypothetical protein